MPVDLPPVASEAELELLWRSLGWLRRLTRPVFLDADRIPEERPLLFVGNHTMLGVVDTPQLMLHLLREHGIMLRPLAEKAHFHLPGWRDFIQRIGAVNGDAEHVEALFAAKEAVLVFPGGAREAFKRKNQSYQLLWGQRVGFARLALRHGVTIIPFAAIGADEVWKILADQEAIFQSPLGEVLRGLRIRPDIVPPIIRGSGPLGAPGIKRQYFAFQHPIQTRPWGGRDDDEAAWEVREQVEAAVQAGIERLQAHREADPYADWARAAGKSIGRRISKMIDKAKDGV